MEDLNLEMVVGSLLYLQYLNLCKGAIGLAWEEDKIVSDLKVSNERLYPGSMDVRYKIIFSVVAGGTNSFVYYLSLKALPLSPVSKSSSSNCIPAGSIVSNCRDEDRIWGFLVASFPNADQEESHELYITIQAFEEFEDKLLSSFNNLHPSFELSMVTPCCGYSLRKGTIIVASMEIIFASVSAIFYIMGLAAVGSPKLDPSEIRTIQVHFRIPFLDVEKATDQAIVGALQGIFVVALVSCIVVLAFSTFLLLSLQRNGNVNHLRLWGVYKVIMLALAAGFILTMGVLGYSTVLTTTSDLLSLLMHLYFFWVVFAYWRELREEKILSMTPAITQIQGNIEVSFPL